MYNLRKIGFEQLFILNHNRRIVDDDLALNLGATYTYALNEVEGSSIKVFREKLDKRYSKVLFVEKIFIEDKFTALLKEILKINEVKDNQLYLDEDWFNSNNRKRIINNGETNITNWITIQPLSSNQIKDLDAFKLRLMIAYLQAKGLKYIFILGSKNQFNKINKMMSKFIGVYNLAGSLSLVESFYLVKHSKLFIGVDSVMSHVAIHYDVPRILFIGGGSSSMMFPANSYYKQKTKEKLLFSKMDCFGCNWNCKYKLPLCLNQIKDEEIDAAIEVLLSNHVFE
ncbi:MAG: glycosyltransferase family 9 protein [bacterium]